MNIRGIRGRILGFTYIMRCRAPIQIGVKPLFLVVRLRIVKGHNNKFYVHDIFVKDEFLKKRGNAIKAGSAGNPVGEPSKSIAHIKSILYDILTVNILF